MLFLRNIYKVQLDVEKKNTMLWDDAPLLRKFVPNYEAHYGQYINPILVAIVTESLDIKL